jgi:DNA-binding IclR family transcriptional regulator
MTSVWPARAARQRKAVLAALEAVGDAGMSPNTLAVTTQLPEPRLEATLQELVDTGLVGREQDRHPTGLRITRPRYHLATSEPPRS